MRTSGGRSSSPVSATGWRSGIATPGESNATSSKGAPNMLPNVLHDNGADHVPVLAEEVRDLLDVQPGETVVDATFGAGGHASVLAAELRGRGRFIAVDRDPTVRPYFERFKRHAAVQ